MRNLRSNPRFATAAKQRGMSLIEIIIVIVLIGAVLTFVGSRVIGGKDRGDYNLGKSAVQTLAGKIESFRMDTGRLPNALDELVTAPGDVSVSRVTIACPFRNLVCRCALPWPRSRALQAVEGPM